MNNSSFSIKNFAIKDMPFGNVQRIDKAIVEELIKIVNGQI